MSAPWYNANPARRREILAWIEAGADPGAPEAVSYEVLRNMERDDIVRLDGMSSPTPRLLVTLAPGGAYERDRLAAEDARPCRSCGERPCTCIPF